MRLASIRFLSVMLTALVPVAASVPDTAMAAAPAAPAGATTFPGLMGGTVDLAAYRGKPVLVVNTASRCGLTPQYEGLQALYDRYKSKGLVVVGVPSGDFGGQELGSSKAIAEFCKLNYGVTFPMTTKQTVTGPGAHPFYRWAKASLGSKAVPGWNFHKILIGKDGKPITAFSSNVEPTSRAITAAVDAALR